MKNLYQEYAELETRIKSLEEQKTALREQILSEMTETDSQKTVTDYGTFSKCPKTTWTYTDKVVALKEKVKLAEVKEQQTGKATANVNYYIRYTQS